MNSPLRILFVEDNPDDVVLLLRALKQEGIEVVWERVETPETFLQALKGSWDIIISDYVMPSFNGMDALRIMQQAGYPLPFILISGTVGEDVAVESVKAGASDYLMKNNLIRFVPAVRRALREAEERKQREQAEQARQESENRQRQLEAQLLQAQKLEALGRFAGAISHDFRNILTGIIGFGELLKMTYADHPDINESVDQILKAANRGKELVQQILTFSGKQAPNRRIIEPIAVIQDVLAFLKPITPNNVRIETYWKESLPNIRADVGQLHQVLVNLCTNAFQAMPNPGGYLQIELQPVWVEEAFARTRPPLREGSYLKIVLRDNGIGMSSEVQKRLFEPFFTTKPKGIGTGLGLAMAHGIVQNHDGIIHVQSEPNRGTEISLYFPTAREESSVPSFPSPPPKTILFVCDEPNLVQMTTMMLKHLGYDAITSQEPLQALTLFQENPTRFQTVLIDSSIPNMISEELAKEMRAISADVPLLLITGYAIPTEESTKSDLFRVILPKPFTLPILAETLKRVLSKST